MADPIYERAIERQLDRRVELRIRYNFGRSQGQPTFDYASRTVFAHREFTSARDQLEAEVSGLEEYKPARFQVRDDYGTPPISLRGQSMWLVDEEGQGYHVTGVQPIGRRRRLQLFCIGISDDDLPTMPAA